MTKAKLHEMWSMVFPIIMFFVYQMYLWIDRGGGVKMIDNFSKLYSVSRRKTQCFFFGCHHLHWNSDALDLLLQRNVEALNDQPNDNDPNACLKGYYNKQKKLQ